jgi:hypothetical protein
LHEGLIGRPIHAEDNGVSGNPFAADVADFEASTLGAFGDHRGEAAFDKADMLDRFARQHEWAFDRKIDGFEERRQKLEGILRKPPQQSVIHSPLQQFCHNIAPSVEW